MGLAEVRARLRMSAMAVLHEVDQDDNALATAIAAKQTTDLLAHLADVLGSDETREVFVKACKPWRIEMQYDGYPSSVGLDADEVADAALAAVREVLGLPGGNVAQDVRTGSVSDRGDPSEQPDDAGAVAGFRGDGVEVVVDERDGWDCG